MRYLITFILFLSFPLAVKSQSNDSLNAEIEVLELKEQDIQQQIDSLRSELRSVRLEVMKKRNAINSSEPKETVDGGIPTKISGAFGILRDEPSIAGNTIVRLSDGDEILVYKEFQNPYVKASYEGQFGYISYGSLEDSEYVLSLKEKVEQNKIDELRKENPRLADLTERFGETTARRIINEEIWIGMTRDMARISLGNPQNVNRSTNAYGVREQWVYPYGKYLYFEDGKLTSWQD